MWGHKIKKINRILFDINDNKIIKSIVIEDEEHCNSCNCPYAVVEKFNFDGDLICTEDDCGNYEGLVCDEIEPYNCKRTDSCKKLYLYENHYVENEQKD